MTENKEKKQFTDKEIIQALVRDIVQFAQQADKVLRSVSVPYSNLEDAVILDTMVKEIMDRFTKDSKEMDSNDKDENNSPE